MDRSKKKINLQKEKTILQAKMKPVGEILKTRRLQLKKTVSQVARETNMSEEKIYSIEKNSFNSFDSQLHTSGFIKIYAKTLGLNVDKVLAVYRRDYNAPEDVKKKKFQNLNNQTQEKEKIGKYILILIPIALILFTISYLYVQYYNFQNPPHLEIFEPKGNVTTEEEKITIKGQTEEWATVEINNTTIALDNYNKFEEEISLQEGNNIITIKATKVRNTSRESTEIINITYTPKEVEVVEIKEKKENEISLEILNEDTWVEIILDNQLIVTEILQKNEKRFFNPKREISISTGETKNLRVTLNNEEVLFQDDSLTILCEIEKDEIQCK